MKDPIFYKIVRPIIKYLFLIVFRPKIIGRKNIKKNESIVLCGNHTNYLDCLLLISCTNRVIHFLAKDSIYKGIKKPIFKGMGIIPVNRSIKDKSVLKKANSVLNNNGVVGVFPEGTINRTNDIIMPFKIGAVKMASDTNSLIIPFIITGKYKILHNNLKIEFLKGYKISNKEIEKENKILMDKVKQKLEKR